MPFGSAGTAPWRNLVMATLGFTINLWAWNLIGPLGPTFGFSFLTIIPVLLLIPAKPPSGCDAADAGSGRLDFD